MCYKTVLYTLFNTKLEEICEAHIYPSAKKKSFECQCKMHHTAGRTICIMCIRCAWCTLFARFCSWIDNCVRDRQCDTEQSIVCVSSLLHRLLPFFALVFFFKNQISKQMLLQWIISIFFIGCTYLWFGNWNTNQQMMDEHGKRKRKRENKKVSKI